MLASTPAPIIVQFNAVGTSSSELYSTEKRTGGDTFSAGTRTVSLPINYTSDGISVQGSALTSVSISKTTVSVKVHLDFSYSGPNGHTILQHIASDLAAEAWVSVYALADGAISYIKESGRRTITATGDKMKPTTSNPVGSWTNEERYRIQSNNNNVTYDGREYAYIDAGYFKLSSSVPFADVRTATWSGNGQSDISYTVSYTPQTIDLSASSFTWTPINKSASQAPGMIAIGSEFLVSTVVVNRGNGNSGAFSASLLVQFEGAVEYVRVGSFIVEDLGANRSKRISANFTLRTPGVGKMFIIVDEFDSIRETKEDNNRTTTQDIRGTRLGPGIYVVARDLNFPGLPIEVPGRHQFIVIVPQVISRRQGTVDLGDGTKAVVLGAYKYDDNPNLTAQANHPVDTAAIQEFVRLGIPLTGVWDAELRRVDLGKYSIDSAASRLNAAYRRYVIQSQLSPITYPSAAFHNKVLYELSVHGVKITATLAGEYDLNSNSWVQSIVEFVVAPGAVLEDFTGFDLLHWTRIDKKYFS
jgi:hypothetical protein